MLRAFKRDHSLFRRKSPEWIHHAQLIKSGSTALVLDIDLETLSTVYANAGDCRLVVCDPDRGHLDASALLLQTDDMNTNTPSERDRLLQEHPNETQMITGNRLFGRLMSTRGQYHFVLVAMKLSGLMVPTLKRLW
jgi:pyruvate dehydrogenase phosphatase